MKKSSGKVKKKKQAYTLEVEIEQVNTIDVKDVIAMTSIIVGSFMLGYMVSKKEV